MIMFDKSDMNLHRINSDHGYFLEMFGHRDPKISSLPHIVSSISKDFINTILEAVDEAVGIWGDSPPFDKHGSKYQANEGIRDTFFAWNSLLNQQDLRNRDHLIRLEQFTCLLALKVPQEAIAQLEASAVAAQAVYLRETWPILIEQIQNIRWFCAQLSDEGPITVFCSADEQIVSRVSQMLDKIGYSWTKVIQTTKGETWHLTDQLRADCGLTYLDRSKDDPLPLHDAMLSVDAIDDSKDIVALKRVADSVTLDNMTIRITVSSDEAVVDVCNIAGMQERDIVLTCLFVTDDALIGANYTECIVGLRLMGSFSLSGLMSLVKFPRLRSLCLLEIPLGVDEIKGLDYFKIFKSLELLEYGGTGFTEQAQSLIVSHNSSLMLNVNGNSIEPEDAKE